MRVNCAGASGLPWILTSTVGDAVAAAPASAGGLNAAVNEAPS
jgi:hypothetical protein